MVTRMMRLDGVESHSTSQRHLERGHRAGRVHVEDGVLVGMLAATDVRHLVTNDDEAIIRIDRLDEGHRWVGVLPRLDPWLLSLCRTGQGHGSAGIGREGHGSVGTIVVSVSRSSIIGCHIVPLDKVCRPGIQGRIVVVFIDPQSLRCQIGVRRVQIDRVLVSTIGWIGHLRPRTQTRLLAVETGGIWIGATDPQQSPVTRVVAATAARILSEGEEAMLEPTHSNLLESSVVVTVEVLSDDRMLVVVGDPQQGISSDVA